MLYMPHPVFPVSSSTDYSTTLLALAMSLSYFLVAGAPLDASPLDSRRLYLLRRPTTLLPLLRRLSLFHLALDLADTICVALLGSGRIRVVCLELSQYMLDVCAFSLIASFLARLDF